MKEKNEIEKSDSFIKNCKKKKILNKIERGKEKWKN